MKIKGHRLIIGQAHGATAMGFTRRGWCTCGRQYGESVGHRERAQLFFGARHAKHVEAVNEADYLARREQQRRHEWRAFSRRQRRGL